VTKIETAHTKLMWFYALTLVASIALGVWFFVGRNQQQMGYSVRPVTSGSGYGFEVCLDGKPIIYQPYIPGQEGFEPFVTPEKALKAGQLVVDKLKMGKLPIVSKEELIEKGIIMRVNKK
jgi:hypothetical protein